MLDWAMASGLWVSPSSRSTVQRWTILSFTWALLAHLPRYLQHLRLRGAEKGAEKGTQLIFTARLLSIDGGFGPESFGDIKKFNRVAHAQSLVKNLVSVQS